MFKNSTNRTLSRATLACVALVCALFLWAAQIKAAVFSDPSYQVLEGEGPYQIIFPSSQAAQAYRLQHWQQQLKKIYDREFTWSLDKKVPIVIAGQHNQNSNAFVSLRPQLWSVFYPGGGYLLDRIAIPSWLFVLAAHETAHLYQLNAKKSPLSRALQKVLRNPYAGSHPQQALWWLLMAPNSLLPLWMLEGNATLNESRFHRGGRLYSGYVKATVLSAIKHNNLTLPRLMNNDLGYHFANKYHWGAYVFKYLLEKWPHISPNALFYQHSQKAWHLNAAFKKVYNKSYAEIFKNFIKSFNSTAAKHQQAQTPLLTTSFMQAPMHRQQSHAQQGHDQNNRDRVLFLSTDARTHPQLNIYDIKTGQLKKQKINLPLGKVFEVQQGSYQASASIYTSPTSRRFTLVKPGFKANKNFYNKIVYDRRAGFTAYTKVLESFNEAQLYVNSKPIGPAHSSALLNKAGDVYYFKQQANKRVLYNNNTPLLSFKGFYAFPVDTGPRGELYFIANTTYGSGLYAYEPLRGGQIRCQHPSDAIVDAKRIGSNKFLIAEIGATAYEYKIIQARPVKQHPVHYQYKWPQHKITNPQSFDSQSLDPQSVNSQSLDSQRLDLQNTNAPIVQKKYGAFRFTKLQSVAPVIEYQGGVNWGGGNWKLQLPLRWADPLNYHNLLTQFDFVNNQRPATRGGDSRETDDSQDPTHQAYKISAEYAWLKHRLKARVFSHLYWRKSNESKNKELQMLGLELRYPLYKSSLASVDALTSVVRHRDYSFLTGLRGGYSLRYPLGWSAYRSYKGFLYHQWKNEHRLGGGLDWQHDWGRENIVALQYQGALGLGEEKNIEVQASRGLWRTYESLEGVSFNSLFELKVKKHNHVSKLGLQYTKVFNHSWYFAHWPLSLRRWALKGEAYYFAAQAAKWHQHFEYAVGTEWELLFYHKMPARLALLYAQHQDQKKFLMQLSFSL